ncbi:hypothetical protein [Streptomyces sp. NPDC051909]|uniref:hypothetical protein n=1 Tax=Streptomyces sp. NPDC051909 TaxID=3154944 RepID=UPI00342D2E8F
MSVLLARPDVSTLRTRQGVWIGVGSSSFTVKGASAFQVVSTLLSRSDGSRTGRELVDAFPAGSRPAVSRVLDALVTRGCVAVLDAPMAQQIAARGPAAEWLIPYLSQLTDEPVRALDRVLATTLHLYGRPDRLDRLRRLLGAAPLSGLKTEFHAVTAGEPVPRWESGGLVVVDADGLSYERIVRVQDALLERGVPHGIVGEVSGRRWILWSDDTVTGCWACLCRYGDTAPSGAPAGVDTSGPMSTASDDDVITAALIHAVHLRGAGLGEHAAAAVSLSLASDRPNPPTVTTHPAWSAAGCRCHRAVVPPPVPATVTADAGHDAAETLVRRNIVSPEDDGRLDDVHARIVDTLRGWTDECVGPFRRLDGGDLTQVPFGRAGATVLVGLAGACRVHELTTATLSPREAIYQAALNALEMFASPAAGAGWTLDEAVYRALLKRSLAQPPDGYAWVDLSDDDLGHGECARFSRYIQRAVLRGRGGEAPRWTGTRLPNGIHRVTGRIAGAAVARGAGACYAEAVSMALLGLVNDAGALVPLNPHFLTWTEVWRHIARPECAEVTARAVPFARGRVRLVEVV